MTINLENLEEENWIGITMDIDKFEQFFSQKVDQVIYEVIQVALNYITSDINDGDKVFIHIDGISSEFEIDCTPLNALRDEIMMPKDRKSLGYPVSNKELEDFLLRNRLLTKIIAEGS